MTLPMFEMPVSFSAWSKFVKDISNLVSKTPSHLSLGSSKGGSDALPEQRSDPYERIEWIH